MTARLDRLLAGPVGPLTDLGVTEDSADLFRLRGAAAEAAEMVRRVDRAESIVRAAAVMTPDELRRAVLDAANLLGGTSGD